MKNIFSKKYAALFMSVLMIFAMSTTAFAAENDSPSATAELSDSEKAAAVDDMVYDNVSIAAGSGTIATFENASDSTKALLYNEITSVMDEYYGVAAPVQLADGGVVYVQDTLAFDVQGISSGEVTLQLKDEGAFKVSNAINHYVVVSHYNGSSWERMSELALVDSNGVLTIKFDSYSPIVLSVLNVTPDTISSASKSSISVKTANYTPTQTTTSSSSSTTSTSSTSSTSTSPKTGENMLMYVLAFLAVASAAGLVVLRRKMAR